MTTLGQPWCQPHGPQPYGMGVQGATSPLEVHIPSPKLHHEPQGSVILIDPHSFTSPGQERPPHVLEGLTPKFMRLLPVEPPDVGVGRGSPKTVLLVDHLLRVAISLRQRRQRDTHSHWLRLAS